MKQRKLSASVQDSNEILKDTLLVPKLSSMDQCEHSPALGGDCWFEDGCFQIRMYLR